jgi:hypothetical protein
MNGEKKEIIVKNTGAGVRIEIIATEEMQKRWEGFYKRLGFAFIKREAVPAGMFEAEGFNPFRDIYYFNAKRQTADLIEALILAENNKLKEEKPELWALLFDLSAKHKAYAEVVLSKDEEGEETLEKIFLAGDKKTAVL